MTVLATRTLIPETLPAGVAVRKLRTHRDDRGAFTEVFRREWNVGIEPVQWNISKSAPNVLRGLHVHWRHTDYVVVVAGEMWVQLKDLRRRSATADLACTVKLSAGDMNAIVFPPRVAHSLYFPVAGSYVIGFTHAYDLADELGCHWNDPEIGHDLGHLRPELSPRDTRAQSLAELRRELDAIGDA